MGHLDDRRSITAPSKGRCVTSQTGQSNSLGPHRSVDEAVSVDWKRRVPHLVRCALRADAMHLYIMDR